MIRRHRFPTVTARRLHQVITDLHSSAGEAGTVQAVVDAVVSAAGFQVAAVSVLRSPHSMETVAVAGSDEARAQLLGVRTPRSNYEEEFLLAHRWGRLLFVPHLRLPDAARRGWIPQSPKPVRRNRWHPLDALYAPLYSPAGDFVGVLSVDLPIGGARPGRRQRQLLEILAVQAGIAIDNARLTEVLGAGAQLFRWAFERAGAGMALISLAPDDYGRHMEVNPMFCRIVGRDADVVTGMSMADLVHPADRAENLRLLRTLGDGEHGSYHREHRYVTGTGAVVWGSLTVAHIGSPDGSVQYAVAQLVDITQSRAREFDLQVRANQDALTGLDNRSAIFEHLRAAIGRAQSSGRPGVVLFVDLDGFKSVNDRFGHLVGDQALAVVARRLRSVIREPDGCGRIGGDEFLVIADDLSVADAQELADRITAAIAEPIDLPGLDIAITASVGHAPVPTAGSTPDALVDAADNAMYQSKRERFNPSPERS